MTDLKKKPFQELTNYSGTDLQYRGTQSSSKASPTTSTSTKFYSIIDKEKPVKKIPLNSKKLKDGLTINPLVDTEEFKLLCKLFVPKKNQNMIPLTMDNAQTIKTLQNHLPLLIPHSNETTNIAYPKLNLELHMFLASIMTNYVASWYLGKLNTDNLDFIASIYQVLCEFIKDFASRFSMILNKENLLVRIDEISDIIDGHLVDLWGRPTLKILEPSRNTVLFDEEKTQEATINEYLMSKHIIFESTESRELYFRIMVNKLLQTVFPPENELLNSRIGYDFVNIIVADLVVEKVITKLATPSFILSTLNKVITSIKSKLDARLLLKASPRVSIRDRIKKLFTLSYKDISYLMIYTNYNTKSETENTSNEEDTHNILENNIFKLLNTLSGFSDRKPLMATILGTLRSVVNSNITLSNKVNEIAKKNLFKTLVQSSIMDDENMSKMLNTLRVSIFRRSPTPPLSPSKKESKESTPTTESQPSVQEMAREIHQILCHKALPFQVLPYMKYAHETDDDMINRIESVLAIFQPEKSHQDPDADSSKLNQLLVVRLWDNLIANLYGEITT